MSLDATPFAGSSQNANQTGAREVNLDCLYIPGHTNTALRSFFLPKVNVAFWRFGRFTHCRLPLFLLAHTATAPTHQVPLRSSLGLELIFQVALIARLEFVPPGLDVFVEVSLRDDPDAAESVALQFPLSNELDDSGLRAVEPVRDRGQTEDLEFVALDLETERLLI
jgi:hypothetical protein